VHGWCHTITGHGQIHGSQRTAWKEQRLAGRFSANEVNGTRFHLRYLIRHPAVHMEQWMTLSADGQIADDPAEVIVLGLPWARLSETISRVDSLRP